MYEIEINWFSPDLDNLAQNFLTAGIGILGIFAVLGILIGCLYIFKFVFGMVNQIEENKKAKQEQAKAVTAPVAPVVASQDNDEETVAVIFASIYAVLEQEYGTGLVPPFIIKNISRK